MIFAGRSLVLRGPGESLLDGAGSCVLDCACVRFFSGLRMFGPAAPGRGFFIGAGALLWAAFLSAVVILIFSAPRGLESTDEASWVLCAANPWASPGWGIHFGFALHPLYHLGGGLAGFRVAGIFVLVLAVLAFGLALLRSGPGLGTGDGWRPSAWILLPSLACAGLHRYSIGTRTPSYDWLLLVAALLFATGWLGMQISRGRRDFALHVALISGGLVLAAVGKWVVLPGYLLLLGALVFWGVDPHRRKTVLGGLALGTLFFAGIFLLYAKPQGVRDTILAGFAQLGSGTHQGLLPHYGVGFLKGFWQVLRACLWAIGLYGVVCLISWAVRKGKKPDWIQVGGFTFLAGLGLAAARGHWQGGVETFSKGLMLMMVWLVGAYLMARFFFRRLDSRQERFGRTTLFLFLTIQPA